MVQYAIRAEGVTFEYPGVIAVDHISFTVPCGIIFGLLGPNGAGKSTTIRLLLGYAHPTSGRVEVLGMDPGARGTEIREHVGVVFDQDGHYDGLTGEQNLEFYARVWRLSKTETKNRSNELLNRFGLWDHRKEQVGTWSRGMRRKLALARALLHRPELLILDEPSAGLDPVAVSILHQELLTLVQKDGMTVILTTHNMAEAEKLCASVGVLKQGKLLTVGSPNELKTSRVEASFQLLGTNFSPDLFSHLSHHPLVSAVKGDSGQLHLTITSETSITELIKVVLEQGGQVSEVMRDRSSLEDVYMALVEDDRHD